MLPILFHVNALGLTVRTSQAFILLATVVGFTLGPRFAESLAGISRRTTWSICGWLAAATFVGGHVHYLINYGGLFSDNPVAALVPWSGLHAGGAIAGLVIAAPVVCRSHRVRFGEMLDALVPMVGIGIAIARLGCFFNGCCYGAVTDLPWGMRFPPDSLVQQLHEGLRLVPHESWSLPVHPLQLYFAAAGLLVTGTTLWLHPRRRYPGQGALVGLLVFAATTFAIEFLRYPAAQLPRWHGMPQLTVVAFALGAVAVFGLLAAEALLAVRARLRGRAATA